MESNKKQTTLVELDGDSAESSALRESESTKHQGSKGQYSDRIKLNQEALSRLTQWCDDLETRLRGVKVTRSDLIHFLILNRKETLSDTEFEELEKIHFDEVRFAQWALEELKSARARGESRSLAEIVATAGLTHSSRTRRPVTKNKPAIKIDTKPGQDESVMGPVADGDSNID